MITSKPRDKTLHIRKWQINNWSTSQHYRVNRGRALNVFLNGFLEIFQIYGTVCARETYNSVHFNIIDKNRNTKWNLVGYSSWHLIKRWEGLNFTQIAAVYWRPSQWHGTSRCIGHCHWILVSRMAIFTIKNSLVFSTQGSHNNTYHTLGDDIPLGLEYLRQLWQSLWLLSYTFIQLIPQLSNRIWILRWPK